MEFMCSGRMLVIFLRSESGGRRFGEFFTANIPNRNTRRAYFVAVSQLSDWCEARNLSLAQIEPVHVAAYVELLDRTHSKPTVK